MAKILFGDIVVDKRGKQGGTVYSRNKGGAFTRNKVTPINPRTSYQTAVRALLASLSQSFRGLTQLQIQAWNSAALNFPRNNVFGNAIYPTGKNLYVGLNQNLANAGQSDITSPPSAGTVGNVGPIVITASEGGGTVAIAWSSGAIDGGSTVIVEATACLSAGVNRVSSRFRVIKTIAAAATSPNAAGTAYLAKFGGLTAGMKIFVRVKIVNNATGQAGQYDSSQVIVSA